jgi:hypothetical protein
LSVHHCDGGAFSVEPDGTYEVAATLSPLVGYERDENALIALG